MNKDNHISDVFGCDYVCASAEYQFVMIKQDSVHTKHITRVMFVDYFQFMMLIMTSYRCQCDVTTCAQCSTSTLFSFIHCILSDEALRAETRHDTSLAICHFSADFLC